MIHAGICSSYMDHMLQELHKASVEKHINNNHVWVGSFRKNKDSYWTTLMLGVQLVDILTRCSRTKLS